MKHLRNASALLMVCLTPTLASATVIPPVPAIPEPTGALLFAAGFALAAIAIRILRRK